MKKILIIDGELFFLEVLKELLQEEGYREFYIYYGNVSKSITYSFKLDPKEVAATLKTKKA